MGQTGRHMPEGLEHIRALCDAGSFRAAANALRELPVAARHTPEGLVLVGRAADALDLRAVARAAYLRAHKDQQTRERAALGLGRIDFHRRRLLRAGRYLRPLLDASSRELRSRVLVEWALILSCLRRFPAAWRAIEAAHPLAETERDVQRVFLARVFLLRAEDQRDEASRLVAEALERFGDQWGPWFARADLSALEGDYRAAIQAARRAVAVGEEIFSHRVYLGELTSSDEAWNDAAQAFESALAISPGADGAGRALLRLGAARERLGDRPGALECYRNAADRPHDPTASAASQLARRLETARARARRVIVRGVGRGVQRHNYCGPASLAAVLQRWGRPDTQDTIAPALCQADGTPAHRYPEYARELGFEVRSFRGRPDVLRNLVESGVPVVLETSVADRGHYLVVVGFDEAHGTFLLRDPATFALRELGEEGLEAVWRPQGWRSMVILPSGELHRIAGIELPGWEVVEQCFEALRRLHDEDTDGAFATLSPVAEADDLGPAGPVLLAQILAARGDIEQATASLCRARERFPAEIHIPEQLALLLGGAGRFEEAVTVCGDILAVYPNHPLALCMRGAAWIELGDPRRGHLDLRRAVEMEPGRAHGHRLLARASMMLEAYGEALECCDFLLDLDEEDAEAHAQRGVALASLGRIGEAEASLRRSLEIVPDHPWTLGHLGQVLHEGVGRLEEAEAMYRKALAADPKYPWAYGQLGMLYRQIERDTEAEACFRRAVEIEPTYGWAYTQLAILCHDGGRPAEAERLYLRALKVHPEDGATLAHLGRLYHEELGRHDEAETCYRKSLEHSPLAAWTHAQLGVFLHDVRAQFEEAEASFRQALELEPEYPWVWAQLARLYHEELDRREDAERLYRRVLEKMPEAFPAWMGLAQILSERKEYVDARKCLERACDIEKDDPWPWAELAKVAKAIKDVADEERCIRRVIELAPKGPWGHWELSRLLLRAERFEEAVPVLRHLVEAHGEHPGVLFNLALALDRLRHAKEARSAWKRYVKLAESQPRLEAARLVVARARIAALRAVTPHWWWPWGKKQ